MSSEDDKGLRPADGQPELLAEEWERQYLWAVDRLRQTLAEVRRWDMLNPGSGPERTSDAPYFRKLIDDAMALTVPRVQKGPYPTCEEEREVVANYIAEHSVLLSGHVRKPWLALAEEIRMGAHWYADANVPRRESPRPSEFVQKLTDAFASQVEKEVIDHRAAGRIPEAADEACKARVTMTLTRAQATQLREVAEMRGWSAIAKLCKDALS